MVNRRMVPEIRFLGFNDPWEQRKFNKLAETQRGLTYKPSDVCENGVRVLRSSNINEDTFVIDKDDVFVKKSAVNVPFVRNGDILITSANGSSHLVGKHAIIRQIDNNSAVIGGFMLLATTKNPYFLNAAMGSSWYKKFINLSVAGGNGAIGNLNKNELDEKTLFVPSNDEQGKIGQYFESIDTIITLHQRKLEKLKTFKKAMLDKMFPKNGEHVPEIRFSGFTDPWEQRKLGDVAQYRNGKAHENCIDENGKYIVVNSKFISTDGEAKKFSNKKNEVLFENEIAFVLSDVPNGRAIARTFLVEKSDKYTLNQRIAGITPIGETFPYFLYILMNRHPYFLTFDDGVKQTNLSVSDVMRFEAYYPKHSEQRKIGIYFKQLDNLIPLHQRKLEKLQNIKKSMLNKMFI